MTCGACNPEAFQPSSTSCRFGYVAGDPMTIAMDTGHLHYYGASHVFADGPNYPGRSVMRCKSLRRLIKLMRDGDTLIITRLSVFGTKKRRALQIVNRIEANGISVLIVPEEKV